MITKKVLKQYCINNLKNIDNKRKEKTDNMIRILKTNLNNKGYNNEFKTVLETALAEKTKLDLIKKKRKYKIYLFSFLTMYTIYNAIQYYYVIYYYFMYDVDIRKPKVSDYILERYR
jgi:hypothetical protein